MIYPTIRHLRAFESVSRLGSFAQAADELCISPSALSQNISQLEEILSAKLIDRTTRQMQLTVLGQQLYPRTLRWLRDMESTFDEVTSQGRLSQGHVKIACLTSVAINILPRAIFDFKATHPDVQVSISDNIGANIERRVLQQEADFGIAGAPVRSPELEFIPLFEEPYRLLCPKDHPLANRENGVTWADVAQYDYIALGPETNIGQQLTISRELTSRMITPVHEVSQLGTLWGLIDKGLGVSALPKSACPDHGALSVRLTEPESTREVGLLVMKRRSLSSEAAAFSAALKRSIQDYVV